MVIDEIVHRPVDKASAQPIRRDSRRTVQQVQHRKPAFTLRGIEIGAREIYEPVARDPGPRSPKDDIFDEAMRGQTPARGRADGDLQDPLVPYQITRIIAT
jgi:hypothetical protein